MLEKLIEELGGILYGLYNLIPEVPKGRLIEEAITRIGKAYADGELELPGETGGRAYVCGFVADEHGDVAIVPGDDMGVQKGDLLIGLRKEGMDKKEE